MNCFEVEEYEEPPALDSLRIVPGIEPKLTSGPVQFAGDIPGVYLSGADAKHYALHLQQMLDGVSSGDRRIYSVTILQQLLWMLKASAD